MDIFTADLGMEGEIKIKIKYIRSTLHLIKMVRNIFYKGKTAKIDNITNIREIYGCIEVSMHCFYCF